MSNPCIIVQARTGGERFPGKVLAPFLGEPMLQWQLTRLHRTGIPGCRIIVAYPETPANRILKLWCDAWHENAMGYDGPENDVLGRYAYVAAQVEADPIIRVTADCPLLDPTVLRLLWEQWEASPTLDHLGVAGTWADGQDCEILSREVLEYINHQAVAVSDREHVTPYAWRHPDLFACATYSCERDCTWQQYSVDTPEDLSLVTMLAHAGLDCGGGAHGWRDIDDILTNTPLLRAMHDQRPPRNHRYVQQVASERGDSPEVTDVWEVLRYGRDR